MRHKKELDYAIRSLKLHDGKMLFLLIGLFIGLTVTVAIGEKQYKEKHVDFIYDSMEIFAENHKVQFQQFIDNKIEILQALTQYPEIYEMNALKQRRFIKGNSQKFGFSHIFVMDKKGNGYYFDDNKYINQSDEQFYFDINGNDIFITEPFLSDNGIITTVCVSIYVDGEKKGVLCGAVRLDEIASMFSEYALPLQGKIFLVNREGVYLVSDDYDKVVNMYSIYDEKDSDVSLVRQAFKDNSDKVGVIEFNGDKYIANLTYMPRFEWVIGQCVNSEKIDEQINFLDLWLLISFVIIVMLMHSVMKIIKHWYQSMNKVNTDVLTGCNSRAYMNNLIEELEKNYNKNIIIVYFDLNKFKNVNDVYGHDEGDRILIIFSDILMSVFDRTARVGRMGGDEFLAVAVNTNIERMEELARNVNDKLQQKRIELKLPYEISTSFGLAERTKGDISPLDYIMKQADKNMYEYKEALRRKDNA